MKIRLGFAMLLALASFVLAGEPAGLPVNEADPVPVVTSFKGSRVSDSKIKLTWAATSKLGINQYQLSREGNPMGTLLGSDTSYIDHGLTPGYLYTYGIIAVDMQGNASAEQTVKVSTAAP